MHAWYQFDSAAHFVNIHRELTKRQGISRHLCEKTRQTGMPQISKWFHQLFYRHTWPQDTRWRSLKLIQVPENEINVCLHPFAQVNNVVVFGAIRPWASLLVQCLCDTADKKASLCAYTLINTLYAYRIKGLRLSLMPIIAFQTDGKTISADV